MTSPTAYPEESDAYRLAMATDELGGDLIAQFPIDSEVLLELIKLAVSYENEEVLKGLVAVMERRAASLVAAATDLRDSAAMIVADRRVNARYLVDDEFRSFIDRGKWPKEGP